MSGAEGMVREWMEWFNKALLEGWKICDKESEANTVINSLLLELAECKTETKRLKEELRYCKNISRATIGHQGSLMESAKGKAYALETENSALQQRITELSEENQQLKFDRDKYITLWGAQCQIQTDVFRERDKALQLITELTDKGENLCCELGGAYMKITELETRLAAIIESAQAVIRLGDRKCDEWDKLKTDIEKAKQNGR